MAERSVVIELHDVTPASWFDYHEFVAQLDALGPLPLSWLVVPDFHRRTPLERAPTFCRALEARLARGDELLLHGYAHADEAAPPRTPKDWLRRRLYTHEGEFAALDEAEAARRIAAGQALFERLGWPLHGFVAPGWLLGSGARRALARSGLAYTSDRQALLRLPQFESLPAPALVWSARSAARRVLSQIYCAQLLERHRKSPVLRLALHPADLRHQQARRYWLITVERLLADGRRARTCAAWLGQRSAAASAA